MKEKLGLGASLLLILVGIVGLWGWVLNIIALTHMASVMTGMGALRIIGIFVAPLGAVLGYV